MTYICESNENNIKIEFDNNNPIVFDMEKCDGRWVYEKLKSLLFRIEKEKNDIKQQYTEKPSSHINELSESNWCGEEDVDYTVLNISPDFKDYLISTDLIKSTKEVFIFELVDWQKNNILKGNYEIYVDPNLTEVSFMLGAKTKNNEWNYKSFIVKNI